MRRPLVGRRPPGPDWLRSRPWTGAAVPAAVVDAPTMLSLEERELLYVLARDYVQGDGAMIDAGCFLGGSTIALASGRAASRRARRGPRVQTYDLFELDDAYKRSNPTLVADIGVGESMLPRFQEVLGPLLEHVDVHAGDICREPWSGDPIEVLFIDLCKTWAINDHVVREFFPALIPGRGVVIQQDLIHEWLPYLTITMGLLAGAFELIDAVPWCSAVYLLTRPIAPSEIPERLDDLSPARKLELFDAGCAPFSGEYRGVIEVSRAVLLAHVGRLAAAAAHLDEIRSVHPDSDRVQHVAGEVGRWLATQAA